MTERLRHGRVGREAAWQAHAPLAGVVALPELFAFETLPDGTMRAGSGRTNSSGNLFGGQLIGQSIAAAQASANGRSLHSLHLNFIKPGLGSNPIDYAVERLRDGRAFSTRLVRAMQGDIPLATASASFRTGGQGVHHQRARTETARPDDAIDILEASAMAEQGSGFFASFLASPSPVEVRIPSLSRFYETAKDARRNYWIRIESARSIADREAHKVLFGYISDILLAGVPMVPHVLPMPGDHLRSISLDHAIWFHGHVDCSRWILFETESPVAAHGCNLARAHAYDLDGALIATVTQEVLQSAEYALPA